MRLIVVGTRNQGKLKEFESLFSQDTLMLRSWKDYNQDFDLTEDGNAFWENAFKKAEITARMTGEVSIADDSGLEVDALSGRPGIFSARYAGQKASDEENIAKVLGEVATVPLSQRGARFVCALVIFAPDGRWEWVEGECRGVITDSPRGRAGFGYDPIFLVPKLGKTFAELSPEVKNRISHRAQAVNKIRPLLEKYLSIT
jgi:XTP/dITP diphosphohydrolase